MKDFAAIKCNLDKIMKSGFLVVCFLFISEVICFDTGLRNISIAASAFSIIRLMSYLVVVLKIGVDFFEKKFNWLELALIVIVSCFVYLVCRNAGSNTVLIFWIFAVASHDMDYKQMSKACLAAHIFSLVLIFSLCFVGILPDNINIRGNGAERHSFGFFYGGLLSHFIMYTVLLYVYVRKDRLQKKELLFLFLGTIFIFVYTDTKSPFALTLLALVLSSTLKMFPQMRKFNSFYKVLSVITGPLSVGTIVFLSMAYDDQRKIFHVMNRVVSDRLSLGKHAFEEYGITALGQKISWSVGGDGGYNYVDSSYLKALFDYGIFFELLIVAVLLVLGLSIIRKKDTWALICLLIVCLHSMFDDQLLWLGSNSFMLCIYPYIKSCFEKNIRTETGLKNDCAIGRKISWVKEHILTLEARKRLFELTYCLYLFETILQYSKYSTMDGIHLLFPLLRLVAYTILIFKLLLDFVAKEFSIKDIGIIALVGIPLAISAYVTKDKNLLIYWIFIVGAKNIKLERLIKLSFFVHIAAILFVLVSCYAGVLENRIFYRNVAEQTGKRECLGFGYTTESPNLFFYTVLMWVYLRKDKIRLVEWLVMGIAVLALYVKTDTKNATILALIAIIGSVILKRSASARTFHKWYTLVAVGIFPLAACFIIWSSYCYSGDVTFWQNFNTLISNRLSLGHSGIQNYGIHFWGQPIVWSAATLNENLAYNYVDSSYVQILLNFGPIILGMILAGAVAVGVALIRKKDTYLLLVLAIIAVHTTFDPQLMWIGYNTFVMMYSYVQTAKEEEILYE